MQKILVYINRDDLRALLKTEMEQYWDRQSRSMQDQIYHYFCMNQKECPETFLKRCCNGRRLPTTAYQAELSSSLHPLKWR